MEDSIKIIGSPANAGANGITALTKGGQLTSLANFAIGTKWADSAPITLSKVAGICGSHANGVVAFGGTASQYLGSVAVPMAPWIGLPAFEHEIAGMVGDLVNGLTAFSAATPAVDAQPAVPATARTPALPAIPATPKQESVVAQISFGDDGVGEWKRKSPPPFDVELMAGDGNGVLIAGDTASGFTKLAKSGPDCKCEWIKLPPLRFAVKQMTGDVTNGFVFAGAGQMAAMDGKGNITKLPALNHELVAMAGNPKDGVVALVKGGTVAYCTDLTKAIWILLGGPLSQPAAATSGTDTGTGTQPAPQPPAPAPAPAPQPPAAPVAVHETTTA
jgi:hypothetical protein